VPAAAGANSTGTHHTLPRRPSSGWWVRVRCSVKHGGGRGARRAARAAGYNARALQRARCDAHASQQHQCSGGGGGGSYMYTSRRAVVDLQQQVRVQSCRDPYIRIYAAPGLQVYGPCLAAVAETSAVTHHQPCTRRHAAAAQHGARSTEAPQHT
jgi:hypothetical protein